MFDYVTNDCWFTSSENMKYIKKTLNKNFVMALKSNRKVALSEEKLAAREFVDIKKLKPGEILLVWLRDVDFPLHLIGQHFKDGDGRTSILYLVSSDLELTYDQITTIYKKRWKIEEYHKSLKNNVSLSKSPTRTTRTQSNHFFAAICAFVKLECISVKSKKNHFALKRKIYIRALKASFGELSKIKNAVFQSDNANLAPA